MLILLIFYFLISNALTIKKEFSILFSRLLLISLCLNTILCYNNTFVSVLHKGIGLYGGLFHVTLYTQSFNIFLFVISIIILILTSFYPKRLYIKQLSGIHSLLIKGTISNIEYNKNELCNTELEQYRIIEYPLIALFIITGSVFLMSSSDLVSIFLSIELQSYGLYIISSIYRNSEQATSGGLTYFLLGGLSSCFILLGSSLLYINTGCTNLESIYLINSISSLSSEVFENSSVLLHSNIIIPDLNSLYVWYNPYYIHLSLIILSVGFLFKISAAPFHFWSPDVYDAIPTIVTTIVAVVAKVSILVFLLELVYYTSCGFVSESSNSMFGFTWTNSLLISSLFSLIIGSVLGLSQFRIKRLYAYSTISHVGFMLLALSINSIESIQAYLFYIVSYTISNLNAFIILLAIGYSLFNYSNSSNKENNIGFNTLKDESNSPIQLISQIRGYLYVNPFLALSLSITLFSFAGVPPLIGFFAKQLVLTSALDNGYVFLSLVAIISSVISAVYYLNVIKEMFFFKSIYYIPYNLSNKIFKAFIDINTNIKRYFNISSFKDVKPGIDNNIILFSRKNIILNSGLSTSISIMTLTILLFIFTAKEWFETAYILTLSLFKL